MYAGVPAPRRACLQDGETEIGAALPPPVQHDVGGLEIAVQYASAARRRQSAQI
jgi:hypothetical protein